MKNILKSEELMMFLLGLYLFSLTGFSWWWFVVLLLTPDISMTGYIINNKTGAFCYNIFHHKGIAILIYLGGLYFKIPVAELCGSILFAHSCMDRFFGYGLKYNDGFAYTHLGIIGNKQENTSSSAK